MKKSFSRSLVNVLFGARTESAKKVKAVKLGLETLEERQMLSVSPVSADDSIPAVEAAASSSETPPISFTLTRDVNKEENYSSTAETSFVSTSSNYANDTNENVAGIVSYSATPPDITSVLSTGEADEEDVVETISISGYIESTNRHEVISNCVLSAGWTVDEKENIAYTTTDEYGFYTFDAVAADAAVSLAFVSGAYNLSVANVDAFSSTDIIGLNMSATLLGSITGKITDAAGSPVTNMPVAAYHNDENVAFTFTDENGNYSFGNLMRDDYTVSIDTSGLYKTATDKTVSLSDNPTQNINFVVSQGSRLTGVVTDDSGIPLEGIDVVAIDSLDNIVTVTTDENGQYCIDGLELGEAEIYIISDNYADPGELSITIDEIDEVLNVQLVRCYTVSGCIYDSEGNPVPNVLIYLSNSNGDGFFGVTDEDGTYCIDGLVPGEYDYEVYDSEYALNLTGVVTVAESDVENFDLTMVSVDEDMNLHTSQEENSQVSDVNNSIADSKLILSSIDSNDMPVLATSGLGEWWEGISSKIDRGYTSLTAALSADYRRQNGYYEEITLLLSKLTKLEPKDGCKCGYNEKVKAYNGLLDSVKQFQTDAKKELDDLKNVTAEVNKTRINIASSLADIILNIVPGSALVKSLKALNDVYQFSQFIGSINEIIDIAPGLASDFKSFLNDCQNSVKDCIDNAINAIKTFTAPISTAFSAAEYGSDACEKFAILIVNLQKCDTKPLKAAITATNDLVKAKLDELSKFETQIDKLYDIYKPSSSNRAQQIQKFIEAKNLKEEKIYEYIGTELRLKTEYELQLKNWSAEKCLQVSKIKTQAKSIKGMFEIGPLLSVITNGMSIYSDIQKLKKLNTKVHKEYKECNDTMYKYRVEVQKAVSTNVPQCTCKKTIDVVFCIDTTGSMGSSIDSVKNNAIRMVEQLDRSDFEYTVSIVLYRDFGDTYVTKYILGYSNNMSSIASTIKSITVSGGGDYPEAANTALMRCVDVLRSSKASQKLIITMSDAPGHSVDNNGQTMQNVLYWTNKLNIKISTSLTGVYASTSAAAPVVLESKEAALHTPLATSGDDVESYWKYMTSESGGKLYYSTNVDIVDDFIAAINDAANAPIISISADKYGFTYVPVSFDASETIAMEDRTATLYEWDWNNDGIYDYSTDNSEVEHIYTYDYAGPVRLRVTDNAGYQSVAFTNIVVANTTDKAFLFTNESGTEDLIICAYNVEDTILVRRGATENSVVVDMTDVVLPTNVFTPTGSIVVKMYGDTNNLTIDGDIDSMVYVYGGSGNDTLIYDNSAATTAENYFLADGMIRTDTMDVVYENIDNVRILGGSATDSFELQVSETIQYTLDGGTENDSLQVSADISKTNLDWVISNIENTTDIAATALDTPVGQATYGSRKINVQWNAVENASGYMVEAATTAEFQDKTVRFFTTETSFAFEDLGQFSSYFFRIAAIGNGERLNSAKSTVIVTEIPEILNVPEWNLADYAGYKSFKLDATTDDNYTASLYGQEKDGTFTLLQAWDFVGADASATITGDSKVSESLVVTASASKLLGAIDFNGGSDSRDTLFIEGTEGDDVISVGTEEVATSTPIYTSNPYEKILANYEKQLGATSKTYLRLKDCYDAAYARLAKMVKTTTSTYGIVDFEEGAKIQFIGVKAITVDAGAGNDVFDVEKLRFNYTFVGGEGTDALDFADVSASATVNLGAPYRQVPIAGDCGLMRLSDEFEGFVGSKFNDYVTAGAKGATIDGNGGSDSVVLVGGDNQVALTGKYQSIAIRGAGVYNVVLTDADESSVNASSAQQAARVKLDAVGNYIALYGGLGVVEATVQGDYASINCGATMQTTATIQGDYATIVSGKGADAIAVVGDFATIYANGGADFVECQGGGAVINLGVGSDVAFVSDGDDGKKGENFVYGESGDDFIFGANTTGRNYFYAGAGNDVIFGGAGQDYIYANSGVNALFGLGGVDRIYGAHGRDVLAASRTSNLENVETSSREELLRLYETLYENWIEDGDLEKTVELLGENSTADGVKDWLYTYRHSDDLVYANPEDDDYVSGVPYGPNWSYLD